MNLTSERIPSANFLLSRDLQLFNIFYSNVFAQEFVLSSLRAFPLVKPFQTPGG